MVRLDAKEQKRRFKAMQDGTTAAAEVRRRLKAGAAGTLPGELSMLDAFGRLANEADRARNKMRDAGLDPEDVQLFLIFSACPRDGSDEMLGRKLLPAPGKIGVFSRA